MKFRTILFALAAMTVAVMSADVAEAGRRCGRKCREPRCGLFCRMRSRCETHEVNCEVPLKGHVQAPHVQAPVEKHVQAPQVQAPLKGNVQAPGKPGWGSGGGGIEVPRPDPPERPQTPPGGPVGPRQDLNAPPPPA